ncbi:MAG: hypothetical protein KatS3mg057_1368 [Herpetosiphonaceae bacterium]|nr:MAG: hypothetical protein KatS3mg057_1368 [Herpetosiphonaceae bacterium]
MNGGLVGGRYDGVNEYGLFVSLHKVMADRPPAYEPGIPYHLFPRLALELCANAEQAAELFLELPHLAPFNYLVADPSGTMIKLECYPGRLVGVLRGQGALAVTIITNTPAWRHCKLTGPGTNRSVGRRRC